MIAADSDMVIVIGSPNSSNSLRLREVAERSGAARAILLPKADVLEWSLLQGVATLGITAGASAPEILVDQLLARLRDHYTLNIEERSVTTEDVIFKLPAPLAD